MILKKAWKHSIKLTDAGSSNCITYLTYESIQEYGMTDKVQAGEVEFGYAVIFSGLR